ncbi:PepSY domain-containing protein [Planctomicrobium sp. SH664]|uniref:PepSY domain-containing protein n=1 Tax=Planctomicrobium sp. SH664 TaxID=3448125 RepID=UPI003F5B051A
MKRMIGMVVMLLASGGLLAMAEHPPAGARPLSEVLTSLEQQGLLVVEASFDDGVWEVEGIRSDRGVEVHVDPRTLRVIREHADSQDSRPGVGSLKASEIVKLLEDAGYSPVTELEWNSGEWEAEARRNLSRRNLRVAAETGKILSDHPDP